MAEFVKVCRKSEIESGKGKVVDLNGRSVAVMNNGGEFFAIDNTCAHMQGPLGDGSCKGGKVTCPLHAWEYDLQTGKTDFSEDVKLDTFEVKIDGDDILVNPEPRGE
ncbi:MAG: hypothetical protein CMH62_02095 [Nanoarchaeota archaeon]|nr:hypothetical protein [Nanoarchaeota archaeon]|tara:strand:- start:413 stop:733 length:321 start_codon:yes stop_codon:yes gene_type:complete